MNDLPRLLKRLTALGLSAALVLLSAGHEAAAAVGRAVEISDASGLSRVLRSLKALLGSKASADAPLAASTQLPAASGALKSPAALLAASPSQAPPAESAKPPVPPSNGGNGGGNNDDGQGPK